jgi:penicillin amidase
MSKISKIFFYIVLIAFSIFSSIFAFYFYEQRKYTGKIIISTQDLSAPVHLHTDEYGFVHIKANNRKDATFAIGVAHARDRLFALDTFRRISRGKLSEILGEKVLEIDKISRTFGFGRAAENDVKELIKIKEYQEIYELFDIYCKGINYWANTHYLPIEYYIIGAKFENWTQVDSYAFFRFMDWSMSGDHEMELFSHLIHDILGKSAFELYYKSLVYDYPYFNETYISEDYLKKHNFTTENGIPLNMDNFIQKMKIPEIKYKVSHIEQSDKLKGFDDIVNGHESNSWIIHGNYTKSGKPILSNDPHMNNRIPSVNYIVKLYIGNEDQFKKGEEDIIVGSIPVGVPFIIIGNNKHLAFAHTTDYRDRGDYVEELLDDENITNAKYYFIDGKKYELKKIVENIKIKGKEDIKYEIKFTRNGPLINYLPKEWNSIGFNYKYKSEQKNISNALSFNFYMLRKVFRADLIYKRMYAKKPEDFIPYLDRYTGPPFSFSWATVSGDIGYTPISYFPIKKNPAQIFSKGYNSSEYDVTKINYISRADTPLVINPEKGFLATANSHPFPDTYKYFSSSYEIPWREHRINELISEIIKNKKFSVADSISILNDTHDSLCELMLPDLIYAIKKYIYPSLYSYRYLEALKKFDCNMSKNSRTATLYQVFVYKLAQHLLLKNETSGIYEGFNNEDEVNSLLRKHSLDLTLYQLVHYQATQVGGIKFYEKCQYFKKGHHCEEYILDVFHRLYGYLKQYGYIETITNEYGVKEETVKKWGDIKKQYYPHTFNSNFLMDFIFSRKIYSEGNKNTIKVAVSSYAKNLKDPFLSIHAAEIKYVNDLSDITRPYICMSSGNSGNILSKYYSNLLDRCEKNHLIKIENYDFKDELNELNISPNN